MTALAVFLGAAVGAPVRYLVDQAVRARLGPSAPWGVVAVNVVGSGVLGALAGATGTVAALVGTGFCGALTTYSTFAADVLRLLEERRAGRAALTIGVTMGAGLAAALGGAAVMG
ncbi:fluoride efflux transporter FluC [Actinokineospora pegani]|uniref:fluoride efflux transporter FluC n=1 Tax=Actinokineospora pegani TaxID=2654637 RepID=UPI0012EA6B05|nr:CrcB family protein [Actinokineospora pegani]